MRIERFVNSKFYRIFEWFYRLLFLNLLVLLISFSLATIPFLIFLNNEDGLFVMIGIILFVILFIPSSITSFVVIKHYMSEQTGNVFVLFLRYFLDTVKRIYLIEIIFLPIFFLTLYGLYFYWQNLGPDYYQDNVYGLISIIAFVVQFFLMIGLLFMFINLMFLFAYFRMKTFDYVKLSLRFTFRYMAQSLIAAVFLLIPPVLLGLLVMRFVPIYLILGISLPQFIMALITRNKFSYLARNLDDLNT